MGREHPAGLEDRRRPGGRARRRRDGRGAAGRGRSSWPGRCGACSGRWAAPSSAPRSARRLGELAGEVVSSSDIGLPLGPAGQAVLIPDNVAKFAEGLGLTDEDVRLYLALRECAHQRLFARRAVAAAAPVRRRRRLRGRDRGRLRQDRARDGRRRHAEPGGDAGSAGRRSVRARGPRQQKAALVRLETALALVEGWVDDVVREATKDRMPAAVQLARPYAGGVLRAGPPSRRSPRWSDCSCGPVACGTRRTCGPQYGMRAGSTGGTSCGRTRTCCRAPAIWTTRSVSLSTPGSWPTSTSRTSCLLRKNHRRPSRQGRSER